MPRTYRRAFLDGVIYNPLHPQNGTVVITPLSYKLALCWGTAGINDIDATPNEEIAAADYARQVITFDQLIVGADVWMVQSNAITFIPQSDWTPVNPVAYLAIIAEEAAGVNRAWWWDTAKDATGAPKTFSVNPTTAPLYFAAGALKVKFGA